MRWASLTSNEARSWRDSKAQSLMVLSLEALARRVQSNESTRSSMILVPFEGSSDVLGHVELVDRLGFMALLQH